MPRGSTLAGYVTIASPEVPDPEKDSNCTQQEKYQAAQTEKPRTPFGQRVKSLYDEQKTKSQPKDCKNIPSHLFFPPL